MAEARVFQSGQLSPGDEFQLSPGLFRHLIQVLRMRAEEEFIVFNGEGGEFQATLLTVGKREASARIGKHLQVDRESALDITLAQSVGKGERMDWAIQKAVEVGAAGLVPLISDRCNVSISADRAAKRLEHWRGVMISASEQCGRTRVPRLQDITSFEDWMSGDRSSTRLILDASGVPLRDALPPDATSISLSVGPEGGFSPGEIGKAVSTGWSVVRLGPRILRTETAGVAAISAIQTLLGDWQA